MDALLGVASFLGIIVFIVLATTSFFKKNGKVKKSLIGLGISFILLIVAMSMSPTDNSSTQNNTAMNKANSVQETANNSNGNTATGNTTVNENTSTVQEQTTTTTGKLKVHYIDVGQADSILIQDGNVNMLIDAGNNADASTVTNYIKKQGITKLDYVIGTHPHEDHIGGLDVVINTFNIGKIYMPRVSNTTKTYTDVLTAIKNKNMKISTPTVGTTFKLNTASVTILAPNSTSYDDLNNYSIVVRLVYGKTSFLFEGDAEDVSEQQMLNKGLVQSATVLKVGHHGSSSSTTTAFLNKVNPKYAVIMVGKDNDYGHPHKITMDKLKAKGIKVYRTDECGTIIATSDGSNVSFNVSAGSYSYSGTSTSSSSSTSSTTKPSTSNTSNTSTTTEKVYVDANGQGLIKGNISSSGEKIYHMPGGAYYDRTVPEAWFKTESEAKAAGYRPSSR